MQYLHMPPISCTRGRGRRSGSTNLLPLGRLVDEHAATVVFGCGDGWRAAIDLTNRKLRRAMTQQGPNKDLLCATVRMYDAAPLANLAGNPEQYLEQWVQAKMQGLPDYLLSGEVEIAGWYPELADFIGLEAVSRVPLCYVVSSVGGIAVEGDEDLRLNISIGATDSATLIEGSQALGLANGLPACTSTPLPPPGGLTLHDMQLFFAWCKVQTYWSGKDNVLDCSRASPQAYCIDFESVNSATSEEWKASRLPSGYRYQIPKKFKSWIS